MELVKELINQSTLVILLGSIIGSIKANKEAKNNETVCSQLFDIMLGTFIGLFVGLHYSNELNLYVSGLVGLIAGAIGAITLEVLIQLAPNLVGKVIKKWFK